MIVLAFIIGFVLGIIFSFICLCIAWSIGAGIAEEKSR